MKKLLLLCISMLVTGMLFSQSVVQQNGRLSVNGNRIVNQQGQSVSFAGPSMFWSNNGWGGDRFYTSGVVSWVRNDWNATIIRAAMGVEDGGGYLEDPGTNKARVQTIVDAAVNEGMYVIIDWHSHFAQLHEQAAIDFFREMAQTYGNVDNVIFEIYNEPLRQWEGDDNAPFTTWSQIRAYAETVISTIRNEGANNLIIVGTPKWSQDVDEASFNPVSDNNTAYTIHFYAATHKQSLRNKATTAMNNGIALFATEWGTCEADGNGFIDVAETNTWMNFFKENGISHCNWSINDKNESASAIEPWASSNGNWADGDLKQSGLIVKEIVQNWSPKILAPHHLPGRIEAEDYHGQSGVQTETTEDPNGGGQNVGFIDNGDWMDYTIDAESAGTYAINIRVAADGAENKTFSLLLNGTTLTNVDFDATGGWQNWTTISTSAALSQGEHTLRLQATSDGFNLNYLDFSFDCPNPALSSIEVSPANPSVVVGESIQLTATGRNDCGADVAINPTWSGNAPNGLFSSTSTGTFPITVSANGISTTVNVSVTNENATLISNSEKNELSLMNTKWFSYHDNPDGGASSISPLASDEIPFTMTSGGANGSNNATKVDYTLNQGNLEFDPYAGFGFDLEEAQTAFDLNGSTGISFWHKGDACYLQVPLSNNLDADYYNTTIAPHTEWTKITLDWTQFSQSPDWGEDIPFNSSNILKFQWQLQGASGTSGEVWIDEVKIEGLVFSTPIDPNCNSSELVRIEITPATPSLAPGESVQLVATGFDACDRPLNTSPTWSGNAPNGLFTANTEGTFPVTATVGNITSSINVNVASIPNTPPVANAGNNSSISLPLNSTTLQGSGTDTDNDALTFSWSQLSGPNSASIDNPSAAATSISNLVEGTYEFELTVDDATDSSTDQVTITVNPASSGNTLVAKNGRLRVNGNKIVNKDGQAVSFAGVSMYWSEPTWGNPTRFWNRDVVNWLVDDWNVGIIRLAMSTGELDPPSNLIDGWMNNPDLQRSLIDEMVQACVDKGVYVIIDWHAHYAHLSEAQATAFFQEMAQKYGDLPNVLWEIYNEPKYTNQAEAEKPEGQHKQLASWNGEIRPYAERVVNAIRAIDNDNLIIVGNPVWSQNLDDVAANPLPNSQGNNIAYTWHFYEGFHDFNALTSKVDQALNANLAVFATEWGYWRDNDDHSGIQQWLNYLKSNDISWCVWELHDNNEPPSLLNPSASSNGGWSDNDLDLFGKYIKPVIQNWNPQECIAQNVPGRIEAESYCEQSGIQTEATQDPTGGSENVGWIDTGDWLEYEVNVASAGNYQINFRIAADGGGTKSLSLSSNGSPISTVNFNATGGWQNWANASTIVNLNQGIQTLRVTALSDGFNFNYIDFLLDEVVPVTGIDMGQSSGNLLVGNTLQLSASVLPANASNQNVTWSSVDPTIASVDANGLVTGVSEGLTTIRVSTEEGDFNDQLVVSVSSDPNPFSIHIEAEEYTFESGTQTEACVEGGLNVGWLDAGDWMAFHNIDIPSAGTYTITYRVASQNGGGQFNFEGNGGAVNYGTVNVASTGGWQNWESISHTVNLSAGVQNFGIGISNGGFNINWLEITSSSSSNARNGVEDSPLFQEAINLIIYPNPVYNQLIIEGLTEHFTKIVIYGVDGKTHYEYQLSGNREVQIDVSQLEHGMYILQVSGDQKIKTMKFMKQ